MSVIRTARFVYFALIIMKKSNILLVHLLFWIANLAPTFARGTSLWQLHVSFNIVSVIVFYLNYFVVMPVLFGRKKYGRAVIGWIALLFLFALLRYGLEEVLYPSWLGIHNYYPGTSIPYYLTDNVLYYAMPVLMFSSLLWLLANFIKKIKENATLKLEKNKAELNFLKSQINPHFLFNNLNSIYSLVYYKSDQALPAIQKLSEMMRYMIKEATLDKVPLAQELKYVRDLIGLQELRVSGTAQVHLEVTGSVESKSIAPLLLIPFIENGFKHGDITDAQQPFIIRLQVKDNGLELYTQNKIAKGNKDTASGVGLANVRQRLELLYPGNYTLECSDKQGTYICNLKLKLHE